VLCPRCRRENRDSSEFCAACGAPLLLRDEPSPRALDVTVPLDRRGPERGARPSTPLPPASRGEPAPAPRGAAANDRSSWDLGRPAGAAREPRLAPPSRPAAALTWDGAPEPRVASPSRSAAAPTWDGAPFVDRVAPATAFDPFDAPGAPGEDVAPLDAELDLAADLDVSVVADEVVLRRAPAFRRALSWAIDLLPFAALTSWIVREAIGPHERAALGSVDGTLDLLARDLGLVLPFLGFLAVAGAVYLALAYAMMGASVGKWATGLRVVGRDGRRPSPRRSVARALFAVMSVALVGLGVLLALFTRSGRALHDLLAGTYVVEKPKR
jgi:resuscitation-promoting factor RpfA